MEKEWLQGWIGKRMGATTKPVRFSRAVIHGSAWSYLSFFSSKLLVFVSTMILARLLTKDDFGVVGYAVTVMNFLDITSDLGVVSAVIYYPEDERTSATAFWLGLTTSLFIFLLAWFIAPYLALFFNDDRATDVIRILALTFPIKALGDINAIKLNKNLAFGRTFLPGFLKALIKGGCSIVLAFLGFGAWSLIWGQLAGTAISVVAFWFASPWKPSFVFDFKIARNLLDYGLKFMSINVVGIILSNLDYLLVGRYLGAAALGVYTIAFRLPDLLIMHFPRILSSILFPVYTRMREVSGNLTRAFSQTTRYVSLVTMPLGVGLAMLAEPFTVVIFTEKWLEAVPVLQSIAFYAIFLSLAYNAGSVYKAQGRPQVLTWLGLFRLALLVPVLWWAVTIARSTAWVGWMQALVAFISGVVNLYLAAKMLELSIQKLLDALRPAVFSTALMAIAVQAARMATAEYSAWSQLIFPILAGGLVYCLSLWLFHRDVVLDSSQKLLSAMSRGPNENRANVG
jgi:PST family polysaccharide transporter